MTLYRIKVQTTASGWVTVDSEDFGMEDRPVDEVAAEAVRGVRDGDLRPEWEWASAEWTEIETLAETPGEPGRG